MPKRGRIGKTRRFEVFRRDNFTCQYCGRKAPEVEIEVDHIVPKSRAGSSDLSNLRTACKDCNVGKGTKNIEHVRLRSALYTLIEFLRKQKPSELLAAAQASTSWLELASKLEGSSCNKVNTKVIDGQIS